MPDAEQRVLRLLKAVGRRSGRLFGFGAADLMAARVVDLRHLPRLPRKFCVRPAVPADEPDIGAFIGDPAKARRLASSGDVGLLATAEGLIQGMEWARLGPAAYDWDARRLGLVFEVPPRCCWLHNGRSGHGGALGGWAMVMGRLPALLAERGIETAYLQVDCEDAYSSHCHASLGFKRVGRVAALRFGRRVRVNLRVPGERWARFGGGALSLDRLPV